MLSRRAWLRLVPLLARDWAPRDARAPAVHRSVYAWRRRLGLFEALLIDSPPAARHAHLVRTGEKRGCLP